MASAFDCLSIGSIGSPDRRGISSRSLCGTTSYAHYGRTTPKPYNAHDGTGDLLDPDQVRSAKHLAPLLQARTACWSAPFYGVLQREAQKVESKWFRAKKRRRDGTFYPEQVENDETSMSKGFDHARRLRVTHCEPFLRRCGPRDRVPAFGVRGCTVIDTHGNVSVTGGFVFLPASLEIPVAPAYHLGAGPGISPGWWRSLQLSARARKGTSPQTLLPSRGPRSVVNGRSRSES